METLHPQLSLFLFLSHSLTHTLIKYTFHSQSVWLLIAPAVRLQSQSIESSRLKTWSCVNKMLPFSAAGLNWMIALHMRNILSFWVLFAMIFFDAHEGIHSILKKKAHAFSDCILCMAWKCCYHHSVLILWNIPKFTSLLLF